MANMLATIIPKTDQLNSDSLIGGPITIKINKINIAAGDQPVSLGYEGDNGRPYKPCKSMRRVLVTIWGEDGNAYIGRSLTLYCDIKVTFGGAAVGGIRISHMSHLDSEKTILLTATRANKKPFTVKPLKVATGITTVTPPALDLVEAGNSASMNGVEAYKTWFAALTNEAKASILPMHQDWKDVAAKADEAEKSAAAMGA